MYRSLRQQAFTIVELLTVITIIGILAGIVIVSYTGVQESAKDASVLSDVEQIEGQLARYATKHNGAYGAALEWYSPSGSNVNIPFTPSPGNVIDVVSANDEYCIRAFNPTSNKDSISNSIQVAAQTGSCERLIPSAAAGGVVPVPTSVNAVTQGSYIQINVTWAAVTAAASYRIEYSTDSNFTSPTTINNVSGTSYALYPPMAGTLYYIRVSTVTVDERVSAPSSPAATATTGFLSPP